MLLGKFTGCLYEYGACGYYLVDNVFVQVGSKIFRQCVGNRLCSIFSIVKSLMKYKAKHFSFEADNEHTPI